MDSLKNDNFDMSSNKDFIHKLIESNPCSEEMSGKMTYTSFRVSFRNYGKIFDMSYMNQKNLPDNVLERQKVVERLVKKCRLKVSYRSVYSTSGRPDDLYEARKRISSFLYVSPVIWTPMKNHFKTFSFGFFPYFDKRMFAYNNKVTLDGLKPSGAYSEDETDLIKLDDIISKRIKLISDGHNMNTIRFDEKDGHLCYCLTSTISDTKDDEHEYQNDLGPGEYFDAVISKNDFSEFVIPEYKMICCRLDKGRWLSENDKILIEKMNAVRETLSKRISVSYVAKFKFDDTVFLYFHYDDTTLDEISRHLGFFEWSQYDN